MAVPLITLTSDFGDGLYVAQMKGVLHQLAPQATVVDISHQVPAQDIQAGAWLLRDIVEAFAPETIHVGIVDPGVGSERGLLAVESLWGRFVAPDNGLLTLVLDDCPHAEPKVHRLTNPKYWRSNVSSTFHGRDILAPVAAWLAKGIPIDKFGPRTETWERYPISRPQRSDHEVLGQIIRIDSFGNLITNIGRDQLPNEAELPQCLIHIQALHIQGIHRCYAEGRRGMPLALLGSNGRLELAIPQGNAAIMLSQGVGAEVRVQW